MDRRTRKRKNTNSNTNTDTNINSNTNLNALTVGLLGRRQPPLSPLEKIANADVRLINLYSGRYPTELNWQSHQMRIDVSGVEYLIRPSMDYDGFLIGGQPGHRECAILLIVTNEEGVRVGNFHGLRKGDDCPLVAENSLRAKGLVLAAWKLCYLFGLEYMELKDNSNIHCGPYNFSLLGMYMLKYGHTWYQSIIPIYPITDIPELPAWDTLQNRALTNRWANIASCLRPACLRDIHEIADGRDDDLAMSVFRDIHQSPNGCVLLYKYMNQFLECSGLHEIRDYQWRTPPIRTPLPPPSQKT